MRIDDRYARWCRTLPAGPRADRAVVRCAEQGVGLEFRLYLRTARLWRLIDEAVTALGVEPPDALQDLCDAFRRARGLLGEGMTRAWIRANGLGMHGFADLVAFDARLALIGEASRTYTLGLPDGIEPVCWLHDAIRLGGLYPGLRQRAVATVPTDGRGRRPDAPDLERALREHWIRLGEPAPDNVEDYARSLDFSDGGAELASALHDRAALGGALPSMMRQPALQRTSASRLRRGRGRRFPQREHQAIGPVEEGRRVNDVGDRQIVES